MYAQVEDIRVRWAGAPESNELIESKLEDATILIKSLYGSRIPEEPSGDLSALLKAITVSIARRSLQCEEKPDIKSISQTAGAFSQSTTYNNPDGNLYLTAIEREALENLLSNVTNHSNGMMTIQASGWWS